MNGKLISDIILWSFVGAAGVLVIKNYKGFVADWGAVSSTLTTQTKILSGQA